MKQVQKKLLKSHRLHQSIKGGKKVYTDFPGKKKSYLCLVSGPSFKENSKHLALLQEVNKYTSGLRHLIMKVIVSQLSFGTTYISTDLGNATCPSKYFLPLT